LECLRTDNIKSRSEELFKSVDINRRERDKMKRARHIIFGIIAITTFVIIIGVPKAFAKTPDPTSVNFRPFHPIIAPADSDVGDFEFRPVGPIFPIGPIIVVDLDDDDDGILNADDNCKDVENVDQDDLDDDGIGDACDEDLDGDGYLNDEDNCLAIPNGDCVDSEGNELSTMAIPSEYVADGEALCIYDADGEAIGPNQDDEDLDGVGDACDEDFGEMNLNEGDLPVMSSDGAGCSLITTASGNSAGMLSILLGFIPLAMSRKRR